MLLQTRRIPNPMAKGGRRRSKVWMEPKGVKEVLEEVTEVKEVGWSRATGWAASVFGQWLGWDPWAGEVYRWAHEASEFSSVGGVG